MTEPTSGDDARQRWEMILRQVLGEEGAREAMSALEASGFDPAQMAGAANLPSDPAAIQAMMLQMQRMMASGGDASVNWQVAHDLARQVAHTGGDPSVTAEHARRVTAALSVADLWLDAATDMPAASAPRSALSRAQWVEATMPTWKRVTGPVLDSVAETLTTMLAEGGITPDMGAMGLPELPQMPGGAGMPGMPGMSGVPGMPGMNPATMLRQFASMVFGMQVGQAAGTLAREAFGTSDPGLPLVEEPTTALVWANVADFAEGLDASESEVLHMLAVREVAHVRLYAHVPWLRSHILGLVEEYARGIDLDLPAMEEAIREIDPSDPEALRRAMSGGVFQASTTPEQKAALERLETALALVEGWVEHVSAKAVAPHLSHAIPLREMLRRRRASGGSAEQVFATLVGLHLRPRRAREAATLWATLEAEGGWELRDSLWAHPDLLPSGEDLDVPKEFSARRQATAQGEADLDAALAEILGGADRGAESDGGDSGDSGHEADGSDNEADGGDSTQPPER